MLGPDFLGLDFSVRSLVRKPFSSVFLRQWVTGNTAKLRVIVEPVSSVDLKEHGCARSLVVRLRRGETTFSRLGNGRTPPALGGRPSSRAALTDLRSVR